MSPTAVMLAEMLRIVEIGNSHYLMTLPHPAWCRLGEVVTMVSPTSQPASSKGVPLLLLVPRGPAGVGACLRALTWALHAAPPACLPLRAPQFLSLTAIQFVLSSVLPSSSTVVPTQQLIIVSRRLRAAVTALECLPSLGCMPHHEFLR